MEDEEEALWFDTPAGVSRFDPTRGTWQTFATTDILPANHVTDITQDQDGVLWFGHAGGGLSRLDPATGQWTTIGEEADVDSADTLAVDQEGNLWVGFWNGVRRYDGRLWQSITVEDGLVHKSVRSITPAPDGTLWFGTEQGVSHYDPVTGEWWSFTADDGLPAGYVYILHAGRDGKLWATAGDNLDPFVFDGTRWTPVSGDDNMPNSLYGVAETPDGVLWMAAGDLVRFDDGIWQRISAPRGLWITGIAAAPDGRLWTSVGGTGVQRYDPATRQWQTFTPADGLTSASVEVLFVDQAGALWVGTEAGLSRWSSD